MKATMFLKLIILSLFSFNVHAQTLNLTLPPVDLNFCVNNKELCDRIANDENNLLPQFEFINPASNRDRAFFYAINVIDVWSTNRAIKGGYGREVNPLLPSYPSLAELITHKTVLIGAYEYAQWLDNRAFVVTMNYTLGAVVVNNLQIIYDNEF